jgi:hypothetical protein
MLKNFNNFCLTPYFFINNIDLNDEFSCLKDFSNKEQSTFSTEFLKEINIYFSNLNNIEKSSTAKKLLSFSF